MKKQFENETKRNPQIMEYSNYRQYLAAYYEYRKYLSRQFSYKVFSRLCNMHSHNYMHLIIKGQRNLTPSAAESVARACHMDSVETQYFLVLVKMNQAKDETEKQIYFSQLSTFQRKKPLKQFTEDERDLLRRWSTLPLLYLSALRNPPDTISALETCFLVPVKREELIEGLRALERHGFVKLDGSHIEWKRSGHLLSPLELNGNAKAYIEMTLPLGLESLKNQILQKTFLSTPLILNENDIKTFQTALQKLVLEFATYSQLCRQGNYIYQLNLQFFPLVSR